MLYLLAQATYSKVVELINVTPYTTMADIVKRAEAELVQQPCKHKECKTIVRKIKLLHA